MERVWERFLTAQDRAVLRKREHQVWGFGERPALVLIDLYRWVFGDREAPLAEAVKEWPGSCGPAAWRALPHLRRMLAAARAARIPVAHVVEAPSSTTGVTGWAEHPKRMRGASMLGDPLMAERYRRRFEIIDDVAPLPGEAVLHKEAPSGFFGTLLPSFLHAHRVDAIILVGESTSGSTHAMNLFDMHEKYADVLGIDEVVSHLEGRFAAGAKSR